MNKRDLGACQVWTKNCRIHHLRKVLLVCVFHYIGKEYLSKWESDALM